MTGLDFLFSAVLLGVGATVFMDLVALAQKHVLSQPSLNYAMVGRWLGHVVRGHIIHRPISASEPIMGERLIGWGAHYLIGVLFAAAFLALTAHGQLELVSLPQSLLFGALTVLAPFLVLQPGMGAGLAARSMPNPSVARLRSLFAHLSFGFGLWLTARCISVFL